MFLLVLCLAGAYAAAPVMTIALLKDMSQPRFKELMYAHHPFVVKGARFPISIWEHLFEIYRSSSVELWNQTNDYWSIFRKEHDNRGDHLCPCAEMSSSIVGQSDKVVRTRDFQVVERAVRPWSKVDTEIIQPILAQFYNTWFGEWNRINMFNPIFSSRGDTRGVLHFHNYEAFAGFAKVGEGTTLYMYPPSAYAALNATIRKAKATVVNAFGWNETKLDDGALIYQVQENDIIHFPSGWFHRVDHRGLYLNIGHSFFVPDLLEARLSAICPHISNIDDREYFAKWTRRHPWWWTIAPVQHFYELCRDWVSFVSASSLAAFGVCTVILVRMLRK
jgi:hypothetical protein